MMVDLDPRFGNNFIDANVLDRTGGPEDAAVEEILRLYWKDAFTLLLPYSVKAEIQHPQTPAKETQRLGQHDKDAFHLVESAKYGGRYFHHERRAAFEEGC